MAAFTFVSGDTDSTLEITCTDTADPAVAINLANCTVRLYWQVGDVERGGTMTVTDAANGVAEYTFVTGDLLAGTMTAEVEIEDTSGHILTCQDVLEYAVRERIKP